MLDFNRNASVVVKALIIPVMSIVVDILSLVIELRPEGDRALIVRYGLDWRIG